MRERSVERAIARGRRVAPRWGQVLVTPEGLWPYQRRVSAALVIHRPGTRLGDRRLLRLRLFLVSESGRCLLVGLAVLGVMAGGWPGAGAVVVAWAALWLWSEFECRRRRLQLRTVRVAVDRRGQSGDVELFNHLARRLDALDAGGYAPVDFEAEWGLIYDLAGEAVRAQPPTKRRNQ